jgi:hypothetical protein
LRINPYNTIVLMALLLIVSQCAMKDPVKPDTGATPVLDSFNVPDSVYLGDLSGVRVSIRVDDPQGYNNIDSVWFSITESNLEIAQDTLADEGLAGDIIPRDGIFSRLLSRSHFQNAAGLFRLTVQAMDAEGHVSDTLSAAIQVLSGESNHSPVLDEPVLPDTLTRQTLAQVFFSVLITDEEGLSNVDSVWCDLYLPQDPAPFKRIRLVDDGSSGDAVASDGIFSLEIDLSSEILISGSYQARFQASDQAGALSAALVGTFAVSLPNEPPVLSNLNAPGAVSRYLGEPFAISVEAQDPQGLDDIVRVYFNATKPDGDPSASNPFRMYDNGDTADNGDEIAGDGLFSIMVEISPSNDTGTYRFDFYAEDRSGAQSDVLTHFLEVE